MSDAKTQVAWFDVPLIYKVGASMQFVLFEKMSSEYGFKIYQVECYLPGGDVLCSSWLAFANESMYEVVQKLKAAPKDKELFSSVDLNNVDHLVEFFKYM